MLTSNLFYSKIPRDVSVKNYSKSQEYFYVYKKGDVLFATNKIADANHYTPIIIWGL